MSSSTMDWERTEIPGTSMKRSGVWSRAAVAAFVLLAVTAESFAQGSGGFPHTAEQKAKWEKAGNLKSKGDDLLRAGRPTEAIEAYRQGLNVMYSASAYYGIARAYTALNRLEDAIEAYKRAVAWSDLKQDLVVNGPPNGEVLFRYAIVLARLGREEQAKKVYYAGLRGLNPDGFMHSEPASLTVVFDPDESGDVWAYSAAGLEAAAEIGLVICGNTRTEDLLARAKRAAELVPGWSLAMFYQGYLEWNCPEALGFFQSAEALEKDSERRAAMKAFRHAHTGDPFERPVWPRTHPSWNGPVARLKIQVLEKAKAQLKEDHSDVADGKP